jgi:hypothetical protein
MIEYSLIGKAQIDTLVKYSRMEQIVNDSNIPFSDIENLTPFFQDKIWNNVSRRLDITEDYIRKYKDNIKWGIVSEYKGRWTEDFIEEFENNFDWNTIAENQKMSFDFVKRHMPKLPLKILLSNSFFLIPEKKTLKEIYNQYNELT